MARRAYFTTVATGPRRPTRIGDLALTAWSAADGGAVMFVIADVTLAQHTTLLADAAVTYLPFEDAVGALVGFGGTLAEVSAANRTLIQTELEARHIPLDGLTGSHTVRDVAIRIIRRFLCRSFLGPDDWTEALDTLVSAIPAVKRQAIATKLQSAGYDTSTIQGSDTVREAIRKVVVQTVRLSRTGSDE
jgi:hypothetical protein